MTTAGEAVARGRDASATGANVERLRHGWWTRLADDGALGPSAAALADDPRIAEPRARLLDALLASGTGEAEAGDAVAAVGSAADAFGRAVRSHGLASTVHGAVFDHLQDALASASFDVAADGGASPLTADRAARCASRARRLASAVAARVAAAAPGGAAADAAASGAEAADAEALGRTLRHDIKTPLQAASLNLELLALESAERGLDTDALETIQQSIEEAVAMLRRFDADAAED